MLIDRILSFSLNVFKGVLLRGHFPLSHLLVLDTCFVTYCLSFVTDVRMKDIIFAVIITYEV